MVYSRRCLISSFLVDLTSWCRMLPKCLPASHSLSHHFFPSPPFIFLKSLPWSKSFRSVPWFTTELSTKVTWAVSPASLTVASGMLTWVLCVSALTPWMGPGLSSLYAFHFRLPFCRNTFLCCHIADPPLLFLSPLPTLALLVLPTKHFQVYWCVPLNQSTPFFTSQLVLNSLL